MATLMSQYDSKDIWSKYDYRKFKIIGEPYFDIDFDDVFYLTDTGRMWDGFIYSLRDKISTHQNKWIDKQWVYHGTDDIIDSIKKDKFPLKVMFNMHPKDGIQILFIGLKNL